MLSKYLFFIRFDTNKLRKSGRNLIRPKTYRSSASCFPHYRKRKSDSNKNCQNKNQNSDFRNGEIINIKYETTNFPISAFCCAESRGWKKIKFYYKLVISDFRVHTVKSGNLTSFWVKCLFSKV